MKKSKIIVLFLVLVLVVTCFCACGPDADSIVKKTLENMASVNSLDMKMVISMDIGSDGSESYSNTKLVVNATCFENPYKMKLVTDMFSIKNTVYYNQDGDKYVIYTDSGLGQWYKQEFTKEDFADQELDLDVMNKVLELSDKFVIEGTEDINGKKATKISGNVELKKLIEIAGEGLSSIVDEDQIDLINGEDLGEIEISFWITDDSYIAKIYIDFTEAISKMAQASQDDESSLGLNYKNISLEISLSNFNNATEFEIPQEALDAGALEDIDWGDLI